MSNIPRTPPKTSRTPIKNKNQIQTLSEPDINTAIASSDYVNTSRQSHKRLRQDSSPREVSLSSPDLREHQASWINDQEKGLSKFLADQAAMMAKMVSDIAEIKTHNSQIKASSVDIQKKNEEIIQSMIFMNKQFDEMKIELDNLRKERHDQQKYIESLEQKIK